MKKESISPQTFAKGLTAGVIVVASLGTLSLSEYPIKGGNYVPGTYSASAQGMESAVKVTITVDNTSITNVSVDVSGETPDVGAAIGDEVSQQILDAQSDQIDGVAGATVSSTAVKTALAEALKKAEAGDTSEEVTTEAVSEVAENAAESTTESAAADNSAAQTAASGSYTPGTYTASAQGLESTVTATGTFDENGLTDLAVDVSGETPEVGAAIGDAMTQKFLDAQSADVDGESGATITSDALKSAVADLFSQASAGSADTSATDETAEETTETEGSTVIDETKDGVGVSVSDSYVETEAAGQSTDAAEADTQGSTAAEQAEAAESTSGSYTPGTYTASAQGLESTVTATGTFDESGLTDLTVDVSGETPEVGAAIGDAMTQKFLDAQSADVDAEAGATITSDALKSAVADLFSQAGAAAADTADAAEAVTEDTVDSASAAVEATTEAAADTATDESAAGVGVAELSQDSSAEATDDTAQAAVSEETAEAASETAGALAQAITEAEGTDSVCLYTPGTYTASAQGMESTVTAYGTFSETGLIALSLDVSGETEGVGNAIGDSMTAKFLQAQSADVDAESGATTTSDALKSAVADLFSQASAGAGTDSAAESITSETSAETENITEAQDVTESTNADAVAGTYTPGTYTASAQGLESTVTVTGTFDATSLTDVTVDVSGETPDVGAAIGPAMEQELLDAQSSDVDVQAGATISSNAVITAAEDVFAQAKAQNDSQSQAEESSSDAASVIDKTGDGVGVASLDASGEADTASQSEDTAVQAETEAAASSDTASVIDKTGDGVGVASLEENTDTATAQDSSAAETAEDETVPAGYGVSVKEGSGQTLTVTPFAQDTAATAAAEAETESESEGPAEIAEGPVEIDETKDGVGVSSKD